MLLTLAVAGGLFGLGDWLVPRASAGARWAFGWSAMWWVIALPAEVVRPRVGAAFGVAMTLVGLVRVLRRGGASRRPILVAGLALILGAPLWLAPPHFYDALVYHLGLPWSWLANRSFAPVDHNLFSHFPLAASTVYLIPVAAKAPEAAAGLHWLTFIAVLGSLVQLAKNLGAGRWSWTAPVLLCGTWHAPWLASLAGADHLVVLGIVVAAELWTEPAEGGHRPWGETGIALSLALSSKYTALMPVAAFLAAAMALCRPRWNAVAAGAIALAASSFWWIRNFLDVGNPFHPLLWNVFGGRGWTLDGYARYSTLVRDGVGGARSVILGPVKLGLPSGLGLSVGIAAAVALAAIFRPRSESSRSTFVAVTVVLSVAGWAATSQTARYALPTAALIAALAAAGVAQLSPWVARATAGLSAIAVAHGLLTLGVFLFGTLGIQRTWTGKDSREAWRHAVTMNDPAAAYRAADGLDRDARILIVGEGRPWGCPRQHHASSPYDTQWLQEVVEREATAADVRKAVVDAGFTHLLINWAELNRLGGEDYGVLLWKTPADLERYREFGMGMTERVWTEGPLEIRAIRR